MEPLASSEYRVLEQFLKGESRELMLLRCQLDSLRPESRFYCPKRFLGFTLPSAQVRRRSGEMFFRIAWGAGGEDWMLGERRPFAVHDVAARRPEGDFVRFELKIEGGLLRQLRLLGRFETDPSVWEPLKVRIDRLRIDQLLYVQRQEDGEPETLVEEPPPARTELFGPPTQSGDLGAWSAWFRAVSELEIPPGKTRRPKLHLPLGVRRARPASEQEIEELEEKQGFQLPEELKEFWRASNGAAFFGWRLRGTYDTFFFDWPGENRLLLIEDMYGDGSILLAEVFSKEQRPSRRARIFHYTPGAKASLATWGSLEECLTSLIQEKQNGQ